MTRRDVESGKESTESCDKLVLSPGAASVRPVCCVRKGLAEMRLIGLVLVGFLAAVAISGMAAAEDAKGKTAFLENKCNRCHAVQTREIEATVKSEKMKGPDMSNVGSERDAAWIQKYVMREVKLHDKKHRRTTREARTVSPR